MDIIELENNVKIMLKQLYVPFKRYSMFSGKAFLLAVENFGLLICCLDRIDYAQVNHKVFEEFSDWRVMYITTNDNLSEERYNIIWALMRGGYMKWLRTTFPRQTRELLVGTNNMARRIIEERLRIWNKKAKYKFLIESNEIALRENLYFELSRDLSFFDYMPSEEEVKL